MKDSPSIPGVVIPVSTDHHLLTLIQSIPHAVYTLDNEWRFCFVNDAVCRLMRRTPEELMGRVIWDVFPYTVEQKRNIYVMLQQAKATGEPVVFEEFYAPYDCWFEVSAYPAAEGMVVYVADVTKRKTEEEKLLSSHEVMQDFLDNAPVPIKWISKDGVIVYANKAELALLGYEASAYIGRNIADFHTDPRNAAEFLKRVARNQELRQFEVQLLTADGNTKTAQISTSVYWKGNQFIHVRCFTHDVTKKRKIQKLMQFLNASSLEFSTVDTKTALDKITQLIVPGYADWFTIDMLDAAGRIEVVKMAHQDAEKVDWALAYRNRVPVDPAGNSALATVLRSGEALLAPEITDDMLVATAQDDEHLQVLRTLQMRSGIMVPMRIKGRTMGAVTFLSSLPGKYDDDDLEFAKDFATRIAVTLENGRLYEEATREIENRIEAERKKDEFISIASHELKTPLTTAKAYIQLLQGAVTENNEEEALQFIEKARLSIDKLQLLVEELLDISKIEAGKLQFLKTTFSLDDLVNSCIEYAGFISKKHRLKREGDEHVKVFGNRERIEQVLMNYILNAIKFSPDSAEIIVKVYQKDGEAIVSVTDFGVGIPKDQLPRLFDRFFRVEDKSYRFAGLGIGLYISAEIIKRHNGKVGVLSEEGKGSTFFFSLPIATE